VQLEPGLHAGNSEIYVRHISDTGETPESMPITWPVESQNLERESAILASVSLYLADRTDIYRASSVSMLAGSIQLQGKARLIDANASETQLELRLDFDRAWSQLTQAINNANIEILDSVRDERRINVAFTGVESSEPPGFFGRLFGRGNDEPTRIDFIIRLTEADQVIRVQAETLSGESAPYEQDLLIRTVNDNLI
jgi:uncharacterized lipoprotein